VLVDAQLATRYASAHRNGATWSGEVPEAQLAPEAHWPSCFLLPDALGLHRALQQFDHHRVILDSDVAATVWQWVVLEPLAVIHQDTDKVRGVMASYALGVRVIAQHVTSPPAFDCRADSAERIKREMR
jgi:hypothetical protein